MCLSRKLVNLNFMDSWLAVIIGAWLLLSVFVSLGLARAMSLSNPSDGRSHEVVAGDADGQRLLEQHSEFALHLVGPVRRHS